MEEIETRYGPTLVPASPDRRTKKPTGWIVATVVLALAFAAAGVFALVEANGLGAANEDLDARTERVAELEGLLEDSEAGLASAEGRLEDADGRIAEDARRIAACDRALDVGVKMDRVLHDLVDNALYNRPLAEWTRLWNQYDALGREWAGAANGCSGDGSNEFEFS